ncbi:MAG: hypothetical protein PVI78_12305 [Anaerolineales bacterium]|jgi:hypothetical protein
MAEFIGGMKPGEYKKLTRTQRSTLWLGAFIAAFFQGVFCFVFAYALHAINHGG